MTMNPLPPQAYTKDTMLKAYQWLMLQNSNIKELATTPDILVSLYLKATRDGESALDRPSIQNFKNELKSLSGMLGELEKPVMERQEVQRLPPSNSSSIQSNSNFQALITEKTVQVSSKTADSLESLDSASRSMIHEVKEEFNLSSDLEALRMLVKIGYNKSKSLLNQ